MVRRCGLPLLVAWALSALLAGGAAAEPVSGPHETIDQAFTTTQPGSPTGLSYSASFHAADDPQGEPPYLRKMIQYFPAGMRWDTSVPDQCTASDAQLSVMGPDACPAGSQVGTGTTDGIFYEPIGHDYVFDRYKHDLFILNNAGEQVMLVKSEGYTVVRGKFLSDGSLEFDTPTCFPTPPTGCADDYILQLNTSTSLPAYTKTVAGQLRSYATTPPDCPADGYWRTPVRFWFSDGSEDTVVTSQPCAPSA